MNDDVFHGIEDLFQSDHSHDHIDDQTKGDDKGSQKFLTLDEKKIRRREKNRIAATTHRKRKRDMIYTYEKDIERLRDLCSNQQRQIIQLIIKNDEINETVKKLKECLDDLHSTIKLIKQGSI